MNLKVTVTNNGTTTLYRLFAIDQERQPALRQQGARHRQARAGQDRRRRRRRSAGATSKGHKVGIDRGAPEGRAARLQIPKDALTRADGVKLHFEEARGLAPADVGHRA